MTARVPPSNSTRSATAIARVFNHATHSCIAVTPEEICLNHFALAARNRFHSRQLLKLHCTINGISAVIDARGKVRERAPQFRRLVLRAQANAYRGTTPYVAFGNTPVLLLMTLLLAIGLRRRGTARD